MWRRIVIGAGAGLGLLILFLALLVTAPAPARPVVVPVRAWLVQSVAQGVSKRLNGSLEIGALEGSLLSAPSLANVVVYDAAGAVVARVDALHLNYRVASLLGGKPVIHNVEIIRPELTLSQTPDGTLNLARALSPTLRPADPGATRGGFFIPQVAVDLKRLRVEDGRSRLSLDSLKGVTEITDAHVTLAGRADDTGIHVTIKEAAAQARPAQVNLVHLRGALRLSGRQWRIEQMQVRTDNTRADLDVTLPAGTRPVQVNARLHPIDAAEVGRLLADDTLRGKLQLDLQAHGPSSDLHIEAGLRAAASQVTLQGRLNAAERPPRYRGTLEARRLDLAALTNQDALQSDLNLVLDIDARGLSPQTLEGQLNVAIQPSHLGDITFEPSRIHVVAHAQRLRIETLELVSSLATISASGSLDFQGASDLTYEASAQLSHLEAWLGVEPLNGGLHLQGSVKGAWPDLNAAGKLTATQVQLEANRLRHLELDYTASQLGAVPHGAAQLRLHDLSIGELAAAAAQLQATYDGGQRRVAFAAQLTQPPRLESRLKGRLSLADGVQHAVLDTIQVRLEDRIWQAPEPLEIAVRPGAFDVRAFRLASGEETISLSGGIENGTLRNVRLEASSIDLTYLQTRLDLPTPVAGRASLVVHAGGTLAEPRLQADLDVIPSTEQGLPFDHLQAGVRYQRQHLSGHVAARHGNRDVMRADVEAPLDLALVDVPLSKRLLNAPLSLSVQILRLPLASLRTIAPSAALSGTLEGAVTLRGTFSQLQLASDLNLRDVGVQNAVDALNAPIRTTAELETASSVAALAAALTTGTFAPRARRFNLRIASASGRLSAAAAGQAARSFTLKDVHLRGDAAWGPDGLQATLDDFQATANAFGLPPTTLSAIARLTLSQFDLQHLQVLTPKSRVEAQGQMTLADQRFDLQIQVPQLHPTEFTTPLPPFLSREITGAVQLGGSPSEPTLRAEARQGEARLRLQGAADLQRLAYSARITLDQLDIASLLPAGDGTFDAQVSLQGSGFSKSERRAELRLDLNSQDFSLAPRLSGVVQAALSGSAVTVDTFHFDSVVAQLTATGTLSQSRQLQADYQVAFKDLTPLEAQLGAPVWASGGLSGSISGTLDALQAQGRMQLENWGYGDFHGERVGATFQGEDLTTNLRATLTVSLDGVQGNALSGVAAAGRLGLDLSAEGSVEHPEAAGVARLTDLAWNDRPLGQLRLGLRLANDTVESHLQWRDGSVALLDVQGTVGLRNDYPIDLQATSSFDLVRLAPFAEMIQKSSGSLDARLRVGGTAKAPDARGTLVLRDGALLLAITGEPYRDIQARLILADNRLEIDELRLASTTGAVRADGWLEVAGGGLKHLQLSLRAQDFTAMNTPSIQARLTGTVEARGSLEALSVKGDLTIPRGRIHIDDFGADPASVSSSDLTVAGVYGGGVDTAVEPGEAATESPLRRILQTELRVRMPRNVWVAGPGTALEMRGSFVVDKNFNEPFVIGGGAETVRGFVGFMGKKFDLERGKVTFTGGDDINPFLDVVARHQVSDYTVVLHVEGESEHPRFSFSSTPQLPEEDIVSLLVFGKTLDRLSGSEHTALSGRAAKLAGNFVSGLLEKGVVEALGLDTFEVEVGDEFRSGSVKGGRYVTQDLFISYQHQLDAQGRNTVGVEYSLSPRMKLKATGDDEGQTSLDLFWRIDY